MTRRDRAALAAFLTNLVWCGLLMGLWYANANAYEHARSEWGHTFTMTPVHHSKDFPRAKGARP